MKKRYENGGEVDIPRFKAVRSGTGEVVTTEDGTPVLSAGYDDPETIAAYKEAARRSRGLQMDKSFSPLRRSPTGLRRLLSRLLRTSEQQEEAEEKDKTFMDAYLRGGKKKGGSVTRGDGIAKRGKTRGRYI
jgi:predicted RNA-binding Zn ribbon-like protein